MKKISEFLSENFQFLEVKVSTYLNRRVFVMSSTIILVAVHFTMQNIELSRNLSDVSVRL